jgi:hypothetical protein
MSLIYLNRRIRLVWTGDPFASLDGFTIQVATALKPSPTSSPIHANQYMYDDQVPDLAIGYGNVGIEEFTDGNVVAGAGPITVAGKDGRSYQVWFASHNNGMLAEDPEITVVAQWRVTAVV